LRASGVFSLDPLTLSVLAVGRTGGVRYGALTTLGHMLAELPLFLLLGLGLPHLLDNRVMRVPSLMGGAALLLYAALSLRDALYKKGILPGA
jgi:LysE type translocator.